MASCYAGPVEDGERAVRALRQFGTPLVDLVGPTLYVDHQSGIDDTVPHGWHYYWKAPTSPAVGRGHRHRRRARLPRHVAEVVRGDVPPGRRGRPRPRDATAYPGRDVHHNIIIDAVWLPEQDDTVGAAETAWAQEFLDALQPHRAGVYVNFLDSDDDTSRVREAYGDDTYRRLAEVKAKYDPENVFHNNKNIHSQFAAAQGDHHSASGGREEGGTERRLVESVAGHHLQMPGRAQDVPQLPIERMGQLRDAL